MSNDDGYVCFLADCDLRRKESLVRKKFRPALVARIVLQASPGCSRKALAKAAKTMVKEENNTSRYIPE